MSRRVLREFALGVGIDTNRFDNIIEPYIVDLVRSIKEDRRASIIKPVYDYMTVHDYKEWKDYLLENEIKFGLLLKDLNEDVKEAHKRGLVAYTDEEYDKEWEARSHRLFGAIIFSLFQNLQ